MKIINNEKTLLYKLEEENIIKEIHKILKTNTSDSRLSWFNVGEYKSKTKYWLEIYKQLLPVQLCGPNKKTFNLV